MGASASKAAQSTARKFPTRASAATTSTPLQRPPPTGRALPQASFTKDEVIKADGIDPEQPESINNAFSSRLQQMGIAQPNPTYSPSSKASPDSIDQFISAPNFAAATSNPTLDALQAREKIEAEAQQDIENMGRSGSAGRSFMSVTTLKDILVMRQRGASTEDIAQRFNVDPAAVRRLGPKGIIAHVQN